MGDSTLGLLRSRSLGGGEPTTYFYGPRCRCGGVGNNADFVRASRGGSSAGSDAHSSQSTFVPPSEFESSVDSSAPCGSSKRSLVDAEPAERSLVPPVAVSRPSFPPASADGQSPYVPIVAGSHSPVSSAPITSAPDKACTKKYVGRDIAESGGGSAIKSGSTIKCGSTITCGGTATGCSPKAAPAQGRSALSLPKRSAGSAAKSADEAVRVVDALLRRRSFNASSRASSLCDMSTPGSLAHSSDLHGLIRLLHFAIVLFLICEPVLRYFEQGRFFDTVLACEMFRDVWLLFLSWFRCLLQATSVLVAFRWYCSGRISRRSFRLWQCASEISLLSISISLILVEGWWIPPAGFTLLVSFVILFKMHSFAESMLEIRDLRRLFLRTVRIELMEELVLRALRSASPLPVDEVAVVIDAANEDNSQRNDLVFRRHRVSSRMMVKYRRRVAQVVTQAIKSAAAPGGAIAAVSGAEGSVLQAAINIYKSILGGELHVATTHQTFTRFLLCPSLVYDNCFPRSAPFRMGYFCKKTAWMFAACVALYLVVVRAVVPEVKAPGQFVGVIIIRLVFPMLCVWILVFFIIFECICNMSAELTEFGDRRFYQDWWNSTTWDEFARKWNVPVHSFLQRHVYLRAYFDFGLSKAQSATVTFFVSACLHELIMGLCFKLARFYMLTLMLTQLPLIGYGHIHRGHWSGNAFFWMGVILGLPALCSLYSREYVAH